MTKARVSIHIAHAAFLPERAATLARLLEQLAPQGVPPIVHRSEGREHASVWAQRMYKAAAAAGAEADIFLNDDVEVSPQLVGVVRAQLEQPTSRIVSLHTVHPVARSLAESGMPWLRTYHVTGPAYWFRRGTAQQVLDYYAECPKGWTSRANEDNVMISFLYRHREPAWNAIPGLVQHDISVPSSLGYEDHPNRRCCVPWLDKGLFPEPMPLEDPEYWRPRGEVPYLDTHWTTTETLARQEACNALGVAPETCWWCRKQPARFGSPESGARMCHVCLHATVGGVINQAMAGAVGQGR